MKFASSSEVASMKTFSEKVKYIRESLSLNQQQLADKTGVSKRSIAAYEISDTRPRGSILRKLATALNVSVDYLVNDNIDDPGYGLEKESYADSVRAKYGGNLSLELDDLLERNAALFAGGTLSQESKDSFFEAIMKAYLLCKEESRKPPFDEN